MSEGDIDADPFLEMIERQMMRFANLSPYIMTTTPMGMSEWYRDFIVQGMIERRRNWRPRVRRAIEEASVALLDHTRGSRYQCVTCAEVWYERDYPSVLAMNNAFLGHEGYRTMLEPSASGPSGHRVMFFGGDCSEIHGLDDERRGIVCEVCGYGAKRPTRPWPQRHDPQAVRYLISDSVVETGLIALALVLLLLAAVAFIAPAMIGR